MRYYFRIYYLTPTREVIHKFKERFNTIVSVNGESHIYTDDKGKELLLESERRKYIRLESIKNCSMEVKIKQGSELLDATIEMVDGVMVVSANEVKFEPKDGDVVACEDYGCLELFIFKERIDETECSCYCYYCEKNNSLYVDNDEYIVSRFATEEEKKKLFDKLAEEGYEWKPDAKELVELKWEPKEGEYFYFPICSVLTCIFTTNDTMYNSGRDKSLLDNGWCFKTAEECNQFCRQLNNAINLVKP